mgnify:CR=1 FL=1
MGDSGVLGRLYDLRARILLLGVSHDNNTSLHLAEYRARCTALHFIVLLPHSCDCSWPTRTIVEQGSSVALHAKFPDEGVDAKADSADAKSDDDKRGASVNASAAGRSLSVLAPSRWATWSDILENSDDFASIGQSFQALFPKLVQIGKVGLADAMLLPMRELVDFAVKTLPLVRNPPQPQAHSELPFRTAALRLLL